MKEKTKGFICGILVSVVILSLSGVALAASQTIEVGPIKIMVNGQEFHPKDANGNDVFTFVYDGTTYAPLRALAEAFGLEVGYDSASNMATVNKSDGSAPASPSVSTPLPLGIGSYVVGTDIPAGKYDVVAVSGSGNFQGKVASRQFGSLNEILAAPDDPGATDYGWVSRLSNLVLADGDTIEIKGSLNLEFIKK